MFHHWTDMLLYKQLPFLCNVVIKLKLKIVPFWGGGLCAREGVFAGHYDISSVRQDTLSRYKEADSCPLVIYQFNHH